MVPAPDERGELGGGRQSIAKFRSTDMSRGRVADESLYFHELIHLVQWRLLGPERFLAAYASGLEGFWLSQQPA
jgi:hypothetical protein